MEDPDAAYSMQRWMPKMLQASNIVEMTLSTNNAVVYRFKDTSHQMEASVLFETEYQLTHNQDYTIHFKAIPPYLGYSYSMQALWSITLAVILIIFCLMRGVAWLKEQLEGSEMLEERGRMILAGRVEQYAKGDKKEWPYTASEALDVLIEELQDARQERSRFDTFIRTQTFLDKLTGTANRVLFDSKLESALLESGARGAVLLLKSETISLAVAIELPLLIVDIQRGGPSTGLPTKTEAADLNIAMFGRHGEAPLPIVASYSPAQCFHAAIEATRIALKYRTPVILLSDGYLANGSEPWLLPDVDTLPDISVPFQTEFNGTDDEGNPIFLPYLRDDDTLARPWAIPGTPGLMHRVGGLEKADKTGNVNYTPENHQLMGDLRQAKIDRIADDYPETEVHGDADADICLLTWGSTYAAAHAAWQRQRRAGHKLASEYKNHYGAHPFAMHSCC